MIEQLDVRPVKVDQILVQWKFKPTLDDMSGYSFHLERSESPTSGWKVVYRFENTNHFVDKLYYKRVWKNLCYRIVVTKNSDGAIWVSQPSGFGYPPNLEALEIIRRNDILLKNKRHGIGIPVLYFLRRFDGFRCTCWDSDKKRVRKADCDDCFQTGYLHGFYDPIITWMNTSPDVKESPVAQWGETEANDAKVFISNYPVANPKDVIIDPVRLRVWTVDRIETTARRAHLLHQILTISYVDRSSVLYKLIPRYPTALEDARMAERSIKTS